MQGPNSSDQNLQVLHTHPLGIWTHQMVRLTSVSHWREQQIFSHTLFSKHEFMVDGC
jgi:hypothetical protein